MTSTAQRAATIRAHDLAHRADAMLGAALASSTGADRFRGAYLAALRGAGGALAMAEAPTTRPRSRSAWVRLAAASRKGLVPPELARYGAELAALSRVRADLDAGITATVDPAVVDRTVRLARTFLAEVERFVGVVDISIAAG